jgi:hypothetical protein
LDAPRRCRGGVDICPAGKIFFKIGFLPPQVFDMIEIAGNVSATADARCQPVSGGADVSCFLPRKEGILKLAVGF